MEVICVDCNSSLPNQNDRCKKCGSTRKVIKLFIEDNLKTYEGFGFKVKDKTKNSKKNPVLNVFQGNEICKNTGELVKKERVIDKTNNKYYEHIETFNGKELHHSDEKLTEHQGHGDAKIKLKK